MQSTATVRSNVNESVLVVVLLYAYWTDPCLDEVMETWAESTVNAIDTRASEAGMFHSFRFLNDASARQSPFETYGGGKSLAKLTEVSSKYDPEAVFQKLVGGFKL